MPPGDRLARPTCGVLPRGNMPYFFVRRSCGQFSLVRSTAPTKMHNKKRVLIVEDNPDLSRVLTRAFRARNLEVVSVSDPDAALKAASNLPPDYAVVDLRLGGHSGLNLIGPLLVVNPVTRILILTGYASIATAVDSIKLGATQYMAKPAHVEDIALALGIDSAGRSDAAEDVPTRAGRGLVELEWKQILGALRATGGNLTEAARVLGMYRRTLQRKLAARSVVDGRDFLSEIRKQALVRRRCALRLTSEH